MARHGMRSSHLVRLLRRYPRATALAMGVILSLLLIAAVEGVGRVLLLMHSRPERVVHPQTWTVSSVASELFAVDDEIIYDVTYTLDHHFRRRTVPDNVDASRVLLFFGGSFVFGQGVADEETLPSAVARRTAQVRVLNYGFMGEGTQHLYTRLMIDETLVDAKPNATDLVYVFIAPHVARVIGSMRVVTGWGRDYPWFALDEQGALVRRGTFRDLPKSKLWFYNLMDGEAYLHLFGADLPLYLKEEDYALTTRLIEESRSLFHEKVPGGRFTVVIFPARPEELDEYQAIIPHLTAAQIPFLDYSELLIGDEKFEQMFYPLDMHPTALAYERVAERLVVDLQLTPGGEVAPDASE